MLGILQRKSWCQSLVQLAQSLVGFCCCHSFTIQRVILNTWHQQVSAHGQMISSLPHLHLPPAFQTGLLILKQVPDIISFHSKIPCYISLKGFFSLIKSHTIITSKKCAVFKSPHCFMHLVYCWLFLSRKGPHIEFGCQMALVFSVVTEST